MAETMFGAITKVKIKPGEERALRQALTKIERENDLIGEGLSSAYLIKSNDEADTFYLVTTFQSEEALKTYDQQREQRMQVLQNVITAPPERHVGQIDWTIEG